MRKLIDRLSLQTLIVISLFLGLAPFVPEPHSWQKIKMLFAGQLSKPIDIGDLIMHLAPVFLLLAKIYVMRSKPAGDEQTGD